MSDPYQIVCPHCNTLNRIPAHNVRLVKVDTEQEQVIATQYTDACIV